LAFQQSLCSTDAYARQQSVRSKSSKFINHSGSHSRPMPALIALNN